MKLSHLAILSALTLTFSCQKENKALKKLNEIKQSVSSAKSMVKEASAIKDDIKKLSETTPLTKEDLKAWLPEEIKGMKRTAYKSGGMSMAGISSMDASYAVDDKSKSIDIKLIDGAGEMGASALTGIRMVLASDYEEETETSTKHTVVKDNYRALEEYNKRTESTNLQLLYDNRIMLTVKSKNMSPKEVWDIVDEINLKKLVQ